MSVGGCSFKGAYLNETSLHTYTDCDFTNADYTTTDPGYVDYYPSCPLEKIVRVLAGYANITESMLITNGLTNLVNGYIITSQSTFRSAIETLQKAYFFDAYEDNGVLNCVAQSLQETIVIPESDLGAVRAGEKSIDKLHIEDTDIYEMPPQINLTFYDYAKDYQQGTVRSRRMYYTEALGEETVNLPIVMTKAEAQQIVDELLMQIWLNRASYSTQVQNKWSTIRPAHILETVVNGIKRVWQVTKVDYDGGLAKLEGKGFKAPQIIKKEVIDPAVNLVTPGEISLYLLDLPLLTETDGPGFYAAAAAGKNYKDVLLFKELISESLIDTLEIPATAGTANTILEDGQTYFFDAANTVDVTLVYGDLSSMPESDVLNGANAALLGDEIIQFKTATLIAENKYRLSGLLRGRKGTEWATGIHAAGERFVLLDSSTIKPETLNLSDIGKEITYKYGYANTEGTEIKFTATGRGYKPYSPCHITGSRDSSGNLTINWIRRTRIGGEWQDNIDALLSETNEAYEVDIVSGGMVKRTLASNAQSVIYTADMQIADFGSIQSSVTVNVYQLSDKVGRGYGKEAVV